MQLCNVSRNRIISIPFYLLDFFFHRILQKNRRCYFYHRTMFCQRSTSNSKRTLKEVSRADLGRLLPVGTGHFRSSTGHFRGRLRSLPVKGGVLQGCQTLEGGTLTPVPTQRSTISALAARIVLIQRYPMEKPMLSSHPFCLLLPQRKDGPLGVN